MKTATLGGRLVEVIDYSARPHQQELDKLIWTRASTMEGPQFLVPVDHRRSGKSSSLVNSLIKICTSLPRPIQAYYLYPIADQVREHLWDNPGILPKFLPQSQVKKKDDQGMVVHFKTGSQLIFDGTDKNPDKHRGGNGFVYVLDEVDDQKQRVFTEIIRPIIEANGGLAVMGGTPRGMKNLHEFYLAGQDPTRPQWWSRLLPATLSKNADGSRLFTDEQLERIRRDYQADGIPQAFEQEMLCAFNLDANQVFRLVDEVCVLEPKEPDPQRHYRIGCDPALTTDYWVNSVIDLHTHEEVALERFQPHSTALGEARTEALVRKYNNADLSIDKLGLGRPIADHLRDKGIEILDFDTPPQKEPLVTNMSMKIDSLSVRFLSDTVGKEELRAFSWKRTPLGLHYQFSAPEGKHDDTVMARAHALWDIGEPLPLPNPPGVLTDMRNSFYNKPQGDYYARNRTYFGATKPNHD